jgi:hypothetical protein
VLLVHRVHVLPQSARLPKRSVALRARVVSALLVHRAHMLPQISRLPSRVVALRARVVSLGPLDLLHWPAAFKPKDGDLRKPLCVNFQELNRRQALRAQRK